MRVLFVSSNPEWTARLDLGDEMREIMRSLKRPDIKLMLLPAAQRLDLKMAVSSADIDILHFSGHATREEGIILRDEDGMEDPVAGTELENLLAKDGKRIKLTVLNACNTKDTAAKIRGSVGAVISTNRELKDDAARRMTRFLYAALSGGQTVEQAYATATNAIREAGQDATVYELDGEQTSVRVIDPPAAAPPDSDAAAAPMPQIEGKPTYDKYFFISYIDEQIRQLNTLIRRSRLWFWLIVSLGVAFFALMVLNPDGYAGVVFGFIKAELIGTSTTDKLIDQYLKKPHLDTLIAIGSVMPALISFFQTRLSIHGNRELQSLQQMRELARASDELPVELQEKLQKILDQCIRGADPEYEPLTWKSIFENVKGFAAGTRDK